jgi:hypothetical protein
MEYAIEGRLSKHALAILLTAEARPAFLRACANIQAQRSFESVVTGMATSKRRSSVG